MILLLLPLCAVTVVTLAVTISSRLSKQELCFEEEKAVVIRLASMAWSYERLRVTGVFRALRAKGQVRGCHLEQKLSTDVQDGKSVIGLFFPKDMS